MSGCRGLGARDGALDPIRGGCRAEAVALPELPPTDPRILPGPVTGASLNSSALSVALTEDPVAGLPMLSLGFEALEPKQVPDGFYWCSSTSERCDGATAGFVLATENSHVLHNWPQEGLEQHGSRSVREHFARVRACVWADRVERRLKVDVTHGKRKDIIKVKIKERPKADLYCKESSERSRSRVRRRTFDDLRERAAINAIETYEGEVLKLSYEALQLFRDYLEATEQAVLAPQEQALRKAVERAHHLRSTFVYNMKRYFRPTQKRVQKTIVRLRVRQQQNPRLRLPLATDHRDCIAEEPLDAAALSAVPAEDKVVALATLLSLGTLVYAPGKQPRALPSFVRATQLWGPEDELPAPGAKPALLAGASSHLIVPDLVRLAYPPRAGTAYSAALRTLEGRAHELVQRLRRLFSTSS